MIRGRIIGVFALACLLSMPMAAEQGQGKGLPRPQAQQRNNQKGQRPRHKLGDWLRAHKNLPPDQQQKALENDADDE